MSLQQTLQDAQRELQILQTALAEHERYLTGLRDSIAERERAVSQLQEALTRQNNSDSNGAALPADQQEQQKQHEYKLALALTLANTAYDALIVVNEDCRIIAINDSAEALFNRYRPIGELLEDVTGIPELTSMVSDVLANREESFEEQITIDKKFYRVRTRVIRRDGNLFIGLALQDVSELVRLNRARRDMVANISHELRTPIANIRLIIESLFHDQDKPKRKQSTSALKTIARETDSLIWLVQELLDLSMIESGQAILRWVDQPLQPIVEESILRLEDQSEEKSIKLIDETPKDLQVLADRDHIRRVLVNLMHNAIKWSPPDETVRVRARVEGDEVIVGVLDNGPGVPEEHRSRVFERFYQVDPSRSNNKDGTGLGLAICRHIIEAHGGRIWIENNPDRADGTGACFLFTLPVAETNASEEVA